MRIEKAIEILIEWKERGWVTDEKKLAEAEQLGIEALKFRLELELEDPEITLEPLPGETEE